jgi:hypothetical protein
LRLPPLDFVAANSSIGLVSNEDCAALQYVAKVTKSDAAASERDRNPRPKYRTLEP